MLVDSQTKKNQIQPTFTDINWTRMSSKNGDKMVTHYWY